MTKTSTIFMLLAGTCIASSLSLDATLTAVDTRNVQVSITNTYPQDISILTWNSHFDPDSAHGSFQVASDSGQDLFRGPSMIQFQYLGPLESQFTTITAGATYNDTFDITELFSVFQEGIYTVIFDLSTPAVLLVAPTTLSDELQSPGFNVQNLPILSITSDPITMQLDTSSTTPNSVAMKKRGAGDCSMTSSPSDPGYPVGKARTGVWSLASTAQASTDNDLWTLYFNAPRQQSLVSTVLQGIQSYGKKSNYYGITETCDPTGADDLCKSHSNTVAYNSINPSNGQTTHITFCPPFYKVPFSLACDFPSINNAQMIDQPGVYFHELVHAPQLNGGLANLNDGNSCYSW